MEQETNEEKLFINAQQIPQQKQYLSRLNKGNSTKAKSIETYEIKISKSDFWPMLVYLCRVSFITTLDIYKAYFKGHHI